MDTVAKPRGANGAGHIPLNDFLPPESPTDMAVQALRRFEPAPAPDFAPMWFRRGFVLTGTAILTAAGCYEMYRVLQVGGITVLESIILALFVLLFAWIAFSFMSSLAGFFVLLTGKKDELGIDASTPLPAIHSRTAMLLPTYNEDPHHLLARLRAIYESVEATGHSAQFDWFVLSDTTDPAIWIAEEKCFLKLRQDIGSKAALFYRHRPENTARKSGNIEEWVRRFGANYECMLILDADSLMTGDCIVRLVAAMEAHPKAALIQTLPIIVNARSLFARWQQFAGRLYGPMLAAGIAWWHGSEGNYWGHNAIIRIRAFAQYAGLPELRGRKPFGGHIMSHDFIEAALMRRGGWAIHMVPTLRGSYEESPPTLADFVARDRRWCQGNLQHLALLPTRGFHWVSRLHLLTGIGSYLTAPLWLIFLVSGILVSLQAQFVRPEYFPKGASLFPQWPAQDPVLAAWVFAGTLGMLIVPKLWAFVALAFDRDTRKKFGGGPLVLAGIFAETILSGLTAPVMMIFQSSAVGEILFGRDAGWQVQRRDDGAVSHRDMLSTYSVPTLVGIAMAVAAYAVSVPLLLWMTPVILGLLLSIPMAMLSSSVDPNRRSRLFQTPEQAAPPPVLVRANELASTPHSPLACPLHELRHDAGLREAHLNNLSGQRPRKRGEVDPHLAIARAKIEDAERFEEAAGFLTPREKFAVLNSPAVLTNLIALPHQTFCNSEHPTASD
ncbi:glucans biosynthesis glucosyltransferase MdoH [Bradyrhizobium sp. WSM 1738]|uniref:glucans biosynthesis glucosyltransferase MdoH n=1 Tax=Bradyrhizobium hereditatis TaxID=2821405 RepID=UPI001CE3911C|nr:glucans biosynthesis glucosyltransferase MdoH [Bradyrhizobium hereditatis]MCA6115743.1 glucans biosynthesis glucosyltransferase MdoH [Bradyrhizobium hereditatis]